MSDLPPAESLGYQVRLTHRAFDRMLNAFLAPAGLKPGFWYYLRALWQEDGLTQRELSERTNVIEATTGAMIAAMEEAELITRERDRQDRRKLNVRLTAQGRALEEELMPLAREINAIATQGIPERDLATCRAVMRQMQENLSRHALKADKR